MANTYILIHGAWQTGQCWEDVVPLLRAAGEEVIAPDLPGHGQSPENIAEQNMQSYARFIVSLLEQQEEPVILAGHSLGGMSISQAAEFCPEKIRQLVYVAALLPQDGQSVDGADTGITPTDWGALAAQGLAADLYDAGRTSIVKPEFISPVLYNDLPAEVAEKYVKRHVRESLAAQYQPVHLGRAFRSVPKTYISCTRDLVIPLDLQERMLAATPCEKVYRMDCGHVPYLSHPKELAEILLEIGAEN